MSCQDPTVLEIEALPPTTTQPTPDRIIGRWGGDCHLVPVRDGLVPAHIWFHFAPDGQATISLRYEDEEREQRRVALGRWSLRGPMLGVAVGQSQVEAPPVLHDDVMRWAGEVLVRL